LIELEVKPGDSKGGGANAAGRSLTTTGKVTTPPINDNWRLFACYDYVNTRPPDERSRVSAGSSGTFPSLTATLYPSLSLIEERILARYRSP
jgi:hypothetical protein